MSASTPLAATDGRRHPTALGEQPHVADRVRRVVLAAEVFAAYADAFDPAS